MKQVKILAFLATIGALLGLTTSVNAAYGMQKVAYHVNYDDAKRQTGALRNIQNHINAVGADKLDLRVIMHGKGLSMLLLPDEAENTKLKSGNANDKQQSTISHLKSQGVTFKVCANTLRGKKINIDQLHDADESDIVPSGVAEVAHLQGRGFSYLKP